MTPRRGESREEFNARRRAAYRADPGLQCGWSRRYRARLRESRKAEDKRLREQTTRQKEGERGRRLEALLEGGRARRGARSRVRIHLSNPGATARNPT